MTLGLDLMLTSPPSNVEESLYCAGPTSDILQQAVQESALS